MVSRKNILIIILLVGLLNVSGCYAGVQESPALVDSFVIANDIQQARADIEKAGGNVRHIFFDDKVLIGKIPSGLKSKYIDAIYSSGDSVPEKYSVEFNAWKSVLGWNALSVEEKMVDVPEKAEPLINDVFDDGQDLNKLVSVQLKSLPLGALSTDTSLYMAGDVSVSIILPESVSTNPTYNTENWSDDEISSVTAEIINGLNWWANNNPNAKLTYIYNYENRVPINYEPINMVGLSSSSHCR
jgi:hypothetical protein